MDKSNIKNKGKTFDPQSWKSNNYVRSNREKLNIKKINNLRVYQKSFPILGAPIIFPSTVGVCIRHSL